VIVIIPGHLYSLPEQVVLFLCFLTKGEGFRRNAGTGALTTSLLLLAAALWVFCFNAAQFTGLLKSERKI
jgi:hypothetical protein